MAMHAIWPAGLVVVVGGTLFVPQPAAAYAAAAEPTRALLAAPLAPSAGPEPAPFLSPRVQAGLTTALGPPAVLGSAALIGGLGLASVVPVAVALAAPLALGAGHVWAGDPWRGAAVGVGGLAVTYGGFFVGVGAFTLASRGNAYATGDAISIGMLTWGALGAAYYAWAMLDAAGTPERMAATAAVDAR